MALSFVLHNTCRVNGVNMLKSSQLSPMKLFSSSALLVPKTSIGQKTVKTLSPISRNISLTSTRNSAAGGSSHSLLWTVERVLSFGLIGVIPAAFLLPSQTLDSILAVSIVMHQHWGLEATVTDYVRPVIFGKIIPKVAQALLLLISAATLGGLFYFNYNDIGITKAVRRLWSIQPNH